MVATLATNLQAGGDIGGVVEFINPEEETIPLSTEEVIIEEVVAPIESVNESVEPKEVEVVLPPVSSAPVEVKEEVVKKEPPLPRKEEKSERGFYTVVKGLGVMGDCAGTLDADAGYGAGLDLGYRFGNGLAAEVDLSYATSDLNNAAANEATFKTAALSLVYTLPLTESIGIFAKAGYMQEQTEVDDLDIDESDGGATYGAGLEYKISETYGLVAEYEGSAIDDSIRGDAVSLGLMYNF